MSKVSNEDLEVLIEGLKSFKKKGVIDPWVLDDGTIIEPLNVLIELKEKRDTTGDKSEQILAEVIDDLYLEMKEGFVDYESRTHQLGYYKERVKQRFHERLKNKELLKGGEK